jgi:hypothetical protein
VGVAINEAGSKEPASTIYRIALGSVGSNRFYDAVLDQHRAVLDKAVAARHCGDAKIGEEHSDSLLV